MLRKGIVLGYYIEMLEELKKEEFDSVYRLLEESFPEDERRTYEKQKELLENENYHIKVFREEDRGNIKAFIAIHEFDSFVYAEHFAVSKEYRNQGLGAQILHQLIKQYDKQICLEVELPEDEIEKRRISFYEREGFVYNDFPYIQPAYSDDKNEVELRIMSYGKPLSFDEFQKVKEILYKKVYNK